jgi:hypothetical protein
VAVTQPQPQPVVTVKVKTYNNQRACERDANKLARDGWALQQVTVVPGHALWGHTVLKWITIVGILSGPSRSNDTITALYTRST